VVACPVAAEEAFDMITDEEVSECVSYPLPDPKYEKTNLIC